MTLGCESGVYVDKANEMKSDVEIYSACRVGRTSIGRDILDGILEKARKNDYRFDSIGDIFPKRVPIHFLRHPISNTVNHINYSINGKKIILPGSRTQTYTPNYR